MRTTRPSLTGVRTDFSGALSLPCAQVPVMHHADDVVVRDAVLSQPSRRTGAGTDDGVVADLSQRCAVTVSRWHVGVLRRAARCGVVICSQSTATTLTKMPGRTPRGAAVRCSASRVRSAGERARRADRRRA